MKKIIAFIGLLSVAWIALLAPQVRAETEDLLKFDAFLDRKTKELTISVRNLNEEPLRLRRGALKGVELTISYSTRAAEAGEEATVSENQYRYEPKLESVEGGEEIIVIAPGEEFKVEVDDAAGFFRSFHALAEKQGAPLHQVRLAIRFPDLLVDQRTLEGPVLYTEGPVLELGSTPDIWPAAKKP